jgi:hypothetical protein
MSKYKREFQIVWSSGHHVTDVKASIVGQLPIEAWAEFLS